MKRIRLVSSGEHDSDCLLIARLHSLKYPRRQKQTEIEWFVHGDMYLLFRFSLMVFRYRLLDIAIMKPDNEQGLCIFSKVGYAFAKNVSNDRI